MKIPTQPAKHVVIPEGATHYCAFYVNPFEQHCQDGRRFVHVDGQWTLLNPHPRHGYRTGAVELQEIVVPADAPQVMTAHGVGIFLGWNGNRAMVDFEVSAYHFRPVAFSEDEITFLDEGAAR